MTRYRALVCEPHADGGEVVLSCPHVGTLQSQVEVGRLLRSGDPVALLDVLGEPILLRVPKLEGAGYRVMAAAEIGPLGYAQEIARLAQWQDEPRASASDSAGATENGAGEAIRAPTAGRYFSRPAPEDPPFVEVGDVIVDGTAVGLLEVMKTFTRVTFEATPELVRARVVAISPTDGDEVDAGDVLLRLEPA